MDDDEEIMKKMVALKDLVYIDVAGPSSLDVSIDVTTRLGLSMNLLLKTTATF